MQGSVDARTQTPLVATALTVVTSGAAALLVDLEALADLVSVGILACFLLVAAATLWRRYAGSPSGGGWGLVVNLVGLVAAAAATSAGYVARAPAWIPTAFLGAPQAVCPCHVLHMLGKSNLDYSIAGGSCQVSLHTPASERGLTSPTD